MAWQLNIDTGLINVKRIADWIGAEIRTQWSYYLLSNQYGWEITKQSSNLLATNLCVPYRVCAQCKVYSSIQKCCVRVFHLKQNQQAILILQMKLSTNQTWRKILHGHAMALDTRQGGLRSVLPKRRWQSGSLGAPPRPAEYDIAAGQAGERQQVVPRRYIWRSFVLD